MGDEEASTCYVWVWILPFPTTSYRPSMLHELGYVISDAGTDPSVNPLKLRFEDTGHCPKFGHVIILYVEVGISNYLSNISIIKRLSTYQTIKH